jgi:hypothetical protein
MGVVNSQPRLSNPHGGHGKFPPEHYPYNTTHTTPDPAREEINNNRSGLPDSKQSVVVALATQGIAEKVAKRLADRYSRERVDEKIEYLEFLQEEQPEKVQNPRGWLRRAIEENYGPPDGFVSQAERARLVAEQEHIEQKDLIRAQAAASIREQEEAEQAAKAQVYRAWLDDTYGTTQQDFAFWEQALQELEFAFISHQDMFQRYIQVAEILKVTETEVHLGFQNEYLFNPLTHPGTKKRIERTLSAMAGHKVQVCYEVIQAPELTVNG